MYSTRLIKLYMGICLTVAQVRLKCTFYERNKKIMINYIYIFGNALLTLTWEILLIYCVLKKICPPIALTINSKTYAAKPFLSVNC